MLPFEERVRRSRVMILDGATGTELARRGVDIAMPLWSAHALLEAPDVLRQIHADYVTAGAELVTANTFRTHARSLAEAGLADRAAALTRSAVQIARQAAGGRAYVAGSLAPLEDCYSPELVPDDEALRREHAAMARHLADAGVDVILVETQNTAREAVAAARAAVATELPTLVSFVCGTNGRLLSGESVSNAVAAILPLKPAALAINCTPAPDAHRPLAELIPCAEGLPCGVYANVGRLQPDQSWVDTDAMAPAVYARYALDWIELGASLVGGCCGTTPEHIRVLSETVNPRD